MDPKPNPKHIPQPTPESIFQPDFILQWEAVREAIKPIWEPELGPLPDNFVLAIEPLEKRPEGKTFNEIIRRGQATPSEAKAEVYYESGQESDFYCNALHELVHLHYYQIGRDFEVDVRGDAIRTITSSLDGDQIDRFFEFVDMFHPDIIAANSDLYWVALSLNESATEAVALHLYTQFLNHYQTLQAADVESAAMHTEPYQNPFVCDNPDYFPVLLAALAQHNFDLEATAHFFLSTPTNSIFDALSSTIDEAVDPNWIEQARRQYETMLRDSLGVTISIDLMADNVNALQEFNDKVVGLEEKRQRVSELPGLLSDPLYIAYAQRNAHHFFDQLMSSNQGRVIEIVTGCVNRVNNQCITREADDDIEMLKADINFALELVGIAGNQFPDLKIRLRTQIGRLNSFI